MRPYLVFCSVGKTKPVPELFGADRLFDVALHDYSHWKQSGLAPREEYYFPFPKAEKLETAALMIPTLPTYRQYAFLDDDLTITTNQINRLFQAGDALNLDLYQPALDNLSHGSHQHLFQDHTAPVRKVPFVEIMCPFFSKAGLDKCLPTFDINISGWGLDVFMWPERVQPWVIDAIAIGHYRVPNRRGRVMRNGLTPMQELWIMEKIK